MVMDLFLRILGQFHSFHVWTKKKKKEVKIYVELFPIFPGFFYFIYFLSAAGSMLKTQCLTLLFLKKTKEKHLRENSALQIWPVWSLAHQ